MKIILFFLTLACATTAAAQTITAQQIIQKAIDSAGGEARLVAVQTVELIQEQVTSDNDTITFAVKKKGAYAYSESLLSYKFVNYTTVYNHGRAVEIEYDTAKSVTDSLALETYALECYPSLDYGYKQLGYKLTRVADLEDSAWHCYGVLVESPLGAKTVSYYDKKTGRCDMIVYPDGSRGIITSYLPYHGIVFPRDILMTTKSHKINWRFLRDIRVDERPDDRWFDLAPLGDRTPPAAFHTGRFRYLPGGDTVERTALTQTDGDKQYRITWFSPGEYVVYRLKDPTKPSTNDNIEFIKARITLWSGDTYCCQYVTSDDRPGTCVIQRIE